MKRQTKEVLGSLLFFVAFVVIIIGGLFLKYYMDRWYYRWVTGD